ncbi:SGNH/GDSL hydrolase family protein [Mariniflexile ostreae]|uniref:SGNH/GDSL hydrolase family protein n=1 Tax=Mariniflexile ostreae TaxID=1520892 RepID=A0ABV5FD22_9FLAO
MNITKQLSRSLMALLLFSACKTTQIKTENNTFVKKELTLENMGVAGNTTLNLISRLEKEVLREKPDLVILMVGTNDMLNSKKFVSYETYRSNLDQIVKRIKENKAQILLMSPPTVDSIYLYMRHDKALFKDTPNVKLQKAGQIVEQVAQDNQVLFVDINAAFKANNLPAHNQDDYIRNEKNSNVKDGVHLKPLGYKFIADNVFNYLKDNGLLNTYKRIICFGDSLTKGSGASGAGTISGENYPSFLYTMLTSN